MHAERDKAVTIEQTSAAVRLPLNIFGLPFL